MRGARKNKKQSRVKLLKLTQDQRDRRHLVVMATGIQRACMSTNWNQKSLLDLSCFAEKTELARLNFPASNHLI